MAAQVNAHVNAHVTAHATADLVDSLVATSRDAMAMSRELQEKGQDELAALWARFADFLIASEIYLGPNSAS